MRRMVSHSTDFRYCRVPGRTPHLRPPKTSDAGVGDVTQFFQEFVVRMQIENVSELVHYVLWNNGKKPNQQINFYQTRIW